MSVLLVACRRYLDTQTYKEESLAQILSPFSLSSLTFNAGGGRNATISPRCSGKRRRLETPSTTIKSPLCWIVCVIVMGIFWGVVILPRIDYQTQSRHLTIPTQINNKPSKKYVPGWYPP